MTRKRIRMFVKGASPIRAGRSRPAIHPRSPAPVASTASPSRGVLIGLGSALGAFAAVGSLGLRVRPAPFPGVSGPIVPPETVPLPEGLPAPVERYYRLTYGERVPVVTSGVISGRGTLRLFGIRFPLRFRFMHEAARNFRSYFELTVFGRPVIRADEHYRDGKFRQELPFGVEEGEPKNDHSAALRMWAEWALWLPAMILQDPLARWEAIDDETALLVVPYGDERERLVVRFDSATGKLLYAEAMKYKHPTDPTKTLWVNAIWLGDRPWAEFATEEIVLNAPVDTSVTRKGPKGSNGGGNDGTGNSTNSVGAACRGWAIKKRAEGHILPWYARESELLFWLVAFLGFAAAVVATAVRRHWQPYGWWLFALLFLAPDLSFAGFAFGKPAGSIVYNLAHTPVLPLLLAVAGVAVGVPLGMEIGLIWLAHIGMDRALGFGLLYPHGSRESHFSRV